MKFLSKKSIVTLMASMVILSCNKDDNGGAPPEPENNAPKIQAQSFNAPEAISDATVIGKVAATDADKDALSFSIKTNSDALFEITDGGDISLATGKSLDFETAASHKLSIDVSDGKATSNAEVTINVVDINENSAPVFTAQTFSAQEIVIGQGGLIGKLSATDSDGDTIAFSFTDPANITAFKLNGTTGEIRTVNSVQGNLDFETTPQYIISVIASDGELSTQADITINVTDFNDRPVATAQTFSVAEDIDNTVLIGQIVATDQDGDVLLFSIETDNDAKFSLSATGELRLRQNESFDFETQTSHTLDISVTDGNEMAITTFTVNIADVVETTTSTFVGSDRSWSGYVNDTGTTAKFNSPSGVLALQNGNVLVVDTRNKAIRSISPTGIVTTLFDDRNSALKFSFIRHIVKDDSDNLYISDTGKHVIWKLTPNLLFGGYNLTVFAGILNTFGNTDGTGTAASFNVPTGLAIDNNNNIYVADKNNGAIRKITSRAVVSTITTIGANSRPEDIAIASDGTLYVSDYGQNFIGKIASGQTTVSPIVGSSINQGNIDGQGSSALLHEPSGLAINNTNTTLYVSSSGNHCIKAIDLVNNSIATIAGSTNGISDNDDGNDVNARFDNPRSIDIDNKGNLFVADYNNNSIRKITFSN